ncbi:hypothetical protein GH714_002805 [Hevea brasiliensis]|uniref:Integrase catalytic domain-containing protein n=1 Tax=Hevea brasiliensis TaxID=3981 RepID=A0A6A6LCF9_HEVBR|nr:hypothetical protein GH714_002805 [Hevea brasiliensis]
MTRRNRVYVLKVGNLRKLLLQECHDTLWAGHLGWQRTLALLKQGYYWHQLEDDVREYTKTCLVCQQDKVDRQKHAGLLQPLLVPTRPWESVSLDFIAGLPKVREYDHILVIIDRFSKYGTFVPMSRYCSTEDTARAFFKHIVKYWGIPKSMVSDRDGRFIGSFWELLDSMQAGTLEPEVALLNASLIPDVFPVLAAAHKTLTAKSRDSLTTRTLHSELVYNYSGSKHITESLKRCGISETSTYILAARFNASLDEMKAVEKLINGKEIDLEELEGRANQAQIQKHYKISGLEAGISTLADAITCRIAARDAL